MAILHTNLPKNRGERDFALQLKSFDDDRLHLWFSIDFVPGVKDIDVLLIHEDIGAFVIEVKAVPIRMIKDIGYNHCKIEGRKQDRGPTYQAYSAYSSLRDFLNPRLDSRLPFFTTSACWSIISRRNWNKNWDDEYIANEWSDSLLFSEDFTGSYESFLARLKYICGNPPIRGGGRVAGVRKEFVEKLSAVLSPSAKPRPTMTDIIRLDNIEKGIKNQLKKDYLSADAQRVMFSGHPGTGKTFRLLQIGMMHAYEGRAVIFLCFNKTLASDIRRLLSFHEKLKFTEFYFEVFDVFQYAAAYAKKHGFLVDESLTHDEWGELIVEEMKESSSKGQYELYDTVLVDESQDMHGWQLDLSEVLLSKSGSVFMARGSGQELYYQDETSVSWLNSFLENGGVKKSLRRNFRNTLPGYLIAKGLYEAYPSIEKLNKVIKIDKSLEFERKDGDLTSRVFLDESELPDYDDSFFPEFQAQIMSAECAKIIEKELSSMDENEEPIDLLVLVPSVSSTYRGWVLSALAQVEATQGVAYTNLIDEEFRRDVTENSKIRATTYFSSRGLEGSRVIVFGFESIEKVCTDSETTVNNLAYIVLSRALFQTTIVMRPINNNVKAYVEHVMGRVESFVRDTKKGQGNLL